MLKRLELKALCMWLLPLSFFAYQFILRLMPGLVVDDVMSKFCVTAADFGFMSSLYYWGYAGMQIPVAVLLDRYPARFVISISALLTVVGTLLFVYSDTWAVVLCGRLAIGIGSAVGFLGASKVLTQWFPSHKYSWYVGLTFSVGLLGAVYGGKPVAFLVQQFTWQTAFTGIAGLGLGLALLIFLFLQAPVTLNLITDQPDLTSLFGQVLRKPGLWLLALSNLLMVGPLEGFADVWAVTYFTKAFSWDKTTAAGAGSFVYIGMLFGGPFLSFIAQRLGSESLVIILTGLAMGSAFVTLLLAPVFFSPSILNLAMFIVGLFCCYQVLVFSVGSKMVPEALKGITVAFLNCMNMMGGAFYHTVIGLTMDMRAQNRILYELADYQWALMVIPAGCFIGATAVLTLKCFEKGSCLKQ